MKLRASLRENHSGATRGITTKGHTMGWFSKDGNGKPDKGGKSTTPPLKPIKPKYPPKKTVPPKKGK